MVFFRGPVLKDCPVSWGELSQNQITPTKILRKGRFTQPGSRGGEKLLLGAPDAFKSLEEGVGICKEGKG